MGYAVRNDGKGWRAVSGPADVMEGESYSETQPQLVADPDATLLGQIAELEALQTPRLLREAMLEKNCIVNKPGCCIDGMRPAAAVAHLDAQLDALRAQLASPPLYQNT